LRAGASATIGHNFGAVCVFPPRRAHELEAMIEGNRWRLPTEGVMMTPACFLPRAWLRRAGLVATALLGACGTTPLTGPAPTEAPAAAASPGVVESGATPITTMRVSAAPNPRAYRQDAATHLYGLNRERIYSGRLPPLLYAIGVLQVEVDGRGQVRNLSWMRAPRHAPEVMAEIERTVRAAAPFPAPARMGRVVYTDTWLWHKSGRFQLDTLTEGQD
jgi:protein TonB